MAAPFEQPPSSLDDAGGSFKAAPVAAQSTVTSSIRGPSGGAPVSEYGSDALEAGDSFVSPPGTEAPTPRSSSFAAPALAATPPSLGAGKTAASAEAALSAALRQQVAAALSNSQQRAGRVSSSSSSSSVNSSSSTPAPAAAAAAVPPSPAVPFLPASPLNISLIPASVVTRGRSPLKQAGLSSPSPIANTKVVGAALAAAAGAASSGNFSPLSQSSTGSGR